MATKKSKAKKGRPAQSATATKINKQAATERRAAAASRRQMLAIILFAVSIFLFFVSIIEGQSAWKALHNFMFGLFGICAYVWPFVLGTVAVLCAMDKLYGKVSAKVVESSVMIMFIGGAIDIFSKHTAGESFWAHLSGAYNIGSTGFGGGFLGALVGQPLYMAFGKIGAGITVCLLIFVFFMLITGTTLLSFFKAVSKPVKKLEKTAENAFMHREEDKKAKVVDIPLGDEPPKTSAPTDESAKKQKKLIDAYHGLNDDTAATTQPPQEPAIPEPAEPVADSGDVDQELIQKINQTIDKKKADQKSGGFEAPTGVMRIEKEEGAYAYPPVTLLKAIEPKNERSIASELEATATRLVDTLRSFGIETRIINISRGPAVTRYELQPSAGVKISKITNLSDDIALNLATAGVRIEAPIPNKAAVGIEVPNKTTSMVGVREIIDSPAFESSKSKLTVALGKDIAGSITLADIAKMPHGLIAGATGSGKSVCINTILTSILYKATPDEVKLLLIDPKVVELGVYNGIPHLLVPVVTDPRKAAGALGWAVTEMEKRYKMFAETGTRDLAGYNRKAEQADNLTKMPHIVIVIDELADLMMTAPKDVEDSICRIAQKARAAGMHLIIATQRPSVDVVTGLIKANVPTRIAFAVSSMVDSRTILDMGGAEKLMGRGDMLFYPVGAVKPTRIQGCFVSDDEVEAVVNYVKSDHSSEYDEDVINEIERQAVQEKGGKGGGGAAEDSGDGDPMIMQAIECVVEAGQASTSLLQRRLKLGYARAARIIDEMEERGVVGPYEGSKPRQVLLSKAQWLEMQARSDI